MSDYSIIIIGGGPAGYVAAVKAAGMGAKVALIEQSELGGTCLNRGCIPTKAYLKNAEIIEHIKKAASRGILLENTAFRVDMEATVAMKDRIVKKLTGGIGSLLRSHGVEVLQGEAVLQRDKTVLLGGTRRISADKILLAGGSRAASLPIPGIDHPRVLTSDGLLSLRELPERLTIVGGGVVGIEMAQVFLTFGSRVTLVEGEDRLLPFMDPALSDFMKKQLLRGGAELRLSSRLNRVEESGKSLTLHLDAGSPIEADRVLLSIGRRAELSALGDLAFRREKGALWTDPCLETSVPGIFAAGDITGRKMLAHAAFKMGETAAVNMLEDRTPVDMGPVPSIVYTLPELASVGLSEEEAARRGEITVGRFPLGANGKALAMGEAEGFVKVVAGRRDGEILGVHIAGPGGAEIINEAAALIAMEVTCHEVAEIVHGHPTVSEAFMEAAADCLGRSLHLPPRRD